ncbi:hypothetical protein FA10DRAFT_94920 [Acaromyces ingoldii]|uniref:Uncharacterized protein n=1 Tax=Acaromyces ingoldii TaxID=215250 RepID=A0A316YTH9_9BASI|nr:hypothetical protein FA10DRAFT_94920 [Acaromyces ingoldii]PWN92531.1 hypothetical protein FA10DRAFT_94920 [Acaromyces ingoldii]
MLQALLLHLLLVSSASSSTRAAGEKPGPQPSKFSYRQPPLPPPSSLPSSSLLLGPPQLASPHHRRAPPAAPAPVPAPAPAPARSAARMPQFPSTHRGPAAAQKPHAGHLDAFDSAGSASPLGFFRSDLVDDLDSDEPDSPAHDPSVTSGNDNDNSNKKDDNVDSNGDGDDDDKADNVVAPPASVLTSSSGAGNPTSESEALLAAMYPCGDAELAMLRGYRQRRRVWRPGPGTGSGPGTGPGRGKHAKHSRQVVVIVPNPVKVSSIKGVG